MSPQNQDIGFKIRSELCDLLGRGTKGNVSYHSREPSSVRYLRHLGLRISLQLLGGIFDRHREHAFGGIDEHTDSSSSCDVNEVHLGLSLTLRQKEGLRYGKIGQLGIIYGG